MRVELIERYLYAVKKYLPEELREDVGKELRANIEDMLVEDYTDDDVYKVLMNLGNPRKLANEYNSKKRYLIGPEYYDKYILVLKKVISIFLLVTLGITFFVWIVESPNNWYELENIIKLIVNLITSVVYGAAQALFWITIVFVILERAGTDDGNIYNRKWTPDDLPELSDNNIKVSRGEAFFDMLITIFLTSTLYFAPQLIALYSIIDGSINTTPLFDIERLQVYIPIILVLAMVQLGMFIWKLIAERWNISMCIINAVYNTAICILLIVMLNDSILINPEILQIISNAINVSTVSTWVIKSKWIIALIIIGIYGWDSIKTLTMCLRKHKA